MCTKTTWLGVIALAVVLVAASAFGATHDVTVSVRDHQGSPVQGFRYLVELDTTLPVTAGVPSSDSLGVNIRRSYAPVVASGTVPGDSAVIALDDQTHYYISILPTDAAHNLSGAQIAPGQTSAEVVVHKLPLETAQISIFVFEDDQPLNNAPDLPAEPPLEGFKVLLSDAGGQVMLDAFGNMLGTTYQRNADGTYVLDGDGAPIPMMMGDGILTTGANGEVVVRNLPPGKYAVKMIPPPGDLDWTQTTTIEGTNVIDAWVKSGEPPQWSEWGMLSWHVWVGFTRTKTLPPADGPSGTITGQVVYTHSNRPPLSPGLNPGRPVPDAWVALNDLDADDSCIYAAPCADDSTFSIENVPPGMYQLVLFDANQDAIIDFRTVIVPAEGGTIELGPTPVYAWFGNLEGNVFLDLDYDGFRDPGEIGLRNQAVAIRFIDGSMYQLTQTDPMGNYAFNEIFPFFFWLVTEVDFARFRSTGATFTVDAGGPLPSPDAVLTPQVQPEMNPNTNDYLSRTEVGETLTQAIFSWADQTNLADWGKMPWGPGANGGISGIVFYATTRAEDNPRFAGAEDWEPGVPRVQMVLYADADNDGVIDDLDGDGDPTLADVDNYPFDWRESGIKGDEDVDHNGNGQFDPGDALNITTTDSWDDNLPDAVGPDQVDPHGNPVRNGAETMATWGQLRPGVFDGGYAFASFFPGGMASGSEETDGLPSGTHYIVQAVPPPGYEILMEQHKNVDFGETYIPSQENQMLTAAGLPPVVWEPPLLVGDLHQVPAELELFPGIESPFANQWRPKSDRKQLFLREGENAAAEFFLVTQVPKAGRVWGVVFNDAMLEFDPASPNKGTNLAPKWVPVSFRDFAGNEVCRVYTDEWGRYNALIPSSFTNSLGTPSGMSPSMLVAVINDAGPIKDPDTGEMILDPWYDPGYNQLRWTFENLPGKTTRLDTPLLPIAAFRGNRTPLDCNFATETPLVASVAGSTPVGGPYVTEGQRRLTIQAVGLRQVPNGDYDPDVPGSLPTVYRDFGFGSSGVVTLGGIELDVMNWSATEIVADVPGNAPVGPLQLAVTRDDSGTSSPIAVTVHVTGDGYNPDVLSVGYGGGAYTTIQDAIDAAPRDALILIAPGTYKENLFLYKAVKLQGWGAYDVTLQAGPMSAAEEQAWQDRLQGLIDAGQAMVVAEEEADFFLEQGAGIFVIGTNSTFTRSHAPRVDGLTIQGALRGGGIFVNAWGRFLEISNNRLRNNQGSFGGGVRLGTPSLVNNETTPTYIGSQNLAVTIRNNVISQNGAIDGGGGIALFKGADRYVIRDNYICGNFSFLYGGGIAHFGLSRGGTIEGNCILNNEAFDEGGGLLIAGELVPAGAPDGTLSEGSGDVLVNANLIQGNLSGDDGGAIRLLMPNGEDVRRSPDNPRRWYRIQIYNNMIVNNVSADVGGGLSLDDAARTDIIHNTIAHNDATATSVDAFGGPFPETGPWGNEPGESGFGALTNSVPQVAGIAARAHSTGLQNAFAPGRRQTFSNPTLHNNILWQNRSFYWDATANDNFGGLVPDVEAGDAPIYWDLEVYGTPTPQFMEPRYSVLTHLSTTYPGGVHTYHASNIDADPQLLESYVNVFQATSKGAAFGNFVIVRFDPLGKRGNYHLAASSPAVDMAAATPLDLLALDLDGQDRPTGAAPDMGADEVMPVIMAAPGPPADLVAEPDPVETATQLRRRQLIRRLRAQGAGPEDIRRLVEQLDSRHR